MASRFNRSDMLQVKMLHDPKMKWQRNEIIHLIISKRAQEWSEQPDHEYTVADNPGLKMA